MEDLIYFLLLFLHKIHHLGYLGDICFSQTTCPTVAAGPNRVLFKHLKGYRQITSRSSFQFQKMLFLMFFLPSVLLCHEYQPFGSTVAQW